MRHSPPDTTRPPVGRGIPETSNLHHSDTLRVMTFNLLTSTKMRRSHPWRLRKRSIARIFREYGPDVVGTQEANLRQLLELAELLPEYGFVGEGNLSRTALSGTDRDWYCAIFYRRDKVRPIEDESDTWWLSPTPDIPASRFRIATRPRVATWHLFEATDSGREFVMGTTHLEAVSGLTRRKSALLLREYIAGKVRRLGEDTPLFLTGDFNAVETSPEIGALFGPGARDARLFDAWLDGRPLDPAASETFRGLGPLRHLGRVLLGPRRIDYVFYRPRLEIAHVERVDFDRLVQHEMARPSDHFPVVADFVLPTPSLALLQKSA